MVRTSQGLLTSRRQSRCHQEDLLRGPCWLLGAVLKATLSNRAGCTLYTSTHEGLHVVRQMVALSRLSIVSHLSVSCTETW